MEQHSDIGLIGLAVMGQNLALNIADHNFNISVFNRTYSKTEAFVNRFKQSTPNLLGFESLQAFVNSLKKPEYYGPSRHATDNVINSLVPLVDEGDIIIDGGNAKWTDTTKGEKS